MPRAVLASSSDASSSKSSNQGPLAPEDEDPPVPEAVAPPHASEGNKVIVEVVLVDPPLVIPTKSLIDTPQINPVFAL